MPSKQDLVKRCIRGDRMAQRALYERYKSKMFVLCLRYANSYEDAEDILQEGFVTVFRDLKQFKGTGSLEGWIRKVILNIALQHIKKQKIRKSSLDYMEWEHLLTTAEPVGMDYDQEMVKKILKLMHKMPPGFRTVLNLYILEGYTHQQIADELQISVGTSKSQLNRAKRFLRDLVEKSLTE